jgi:hypothetical protein
MKLPSILRIPSYQRFNYEPRHYDPIKEDIDQRTERIRRRIAADKKAGNYSARDRIEGAFTKRAPQKENEGFIRLTIAAILFGGVVGYLYYGNIALFITVGLVLAYMVFKKLFTK